MEFFREVKAPALDAQKLKKDILISTLPEFCSSIENVISVENDQGEIYCLWGQFSITREIIKYGVRFSLLNCPHALAWSITYSQITDEIIIHCTIDKKEEAKEFIDSIIQFMSDWEKGLGDYLQ